MDDETTGTIYASGPSLMNDISSYPKTDVKISINTSILFYRPEGNYYYLSLDFPKWLQEKIPDDAMVLMSPSQRYLEGTLPYTIPFVFKIEKVMAFDDFPFLINYSQAIWTAMHFLVTQGCTKIYGAGVCLHAGPQGEFYFNGPASDVTTGSPWDIFERIEDTWKNRVKPNLDKLGITFISEALNNGKH